MCGLFVCLIYFLFVVVFFFLMSELVLSVVSVLALWFHCFK